VPLLVFLKVDPQVALEGVGVTIKDRVEIFARSSASVGVCGVGVASTRRRL